MEADVTSCRSSQREVIVPAARVPTAGVRLTGGLFKQAHEDNIGYLKSLSMESVLYWFRVRAALPAPGG